MPVRVVGRGDEAVAHLGQEAPDDRPHDGLALDLLQRDDVGVERPQGVREQAEALRDARRVGAALGRTRVVRVVVRVDEVLDVECRHADGVAERIGVTGQERLRSAERDGLRRGGKRERGEEDEQEPGHGSKDRGPGRTPRRARAP